MIFRYQTKNINIKKLINLSKLKKIFILDYGCGLGIWNNLNLKEKKIKKIILFDKEKKLINLIKKKYKNKNIKINFNLNKIIKKEYYNLIIFFSVIQYIEKKQLFNLIKKLSFEKTYIISDIPFLPRFIEFLLLPIFNLNRFFFVLKIIFSKRYKNLNYNIYKKKDFKIFKKYFNISFHKNLHDIKHLRYTVVFHPKN